MCQLAIIGLTLLQVNSNLKKLTDEKEGLKAPQPVPFYRNKSYLLMVVFVLFMVGGYFRKCCKTCCHGPYHH